MLYIVSTPIGNLKDITLRAIETLKNVDLIAAEDTRHTRILLNAYEIKTPLTSYYEHNKLSKSSYILKLLMEGKDIALVSDAGTPGISDPGYVLIKLAKENDILVTAIPGATAFVMALTLSGMPANSFSFEGFLPVKSVARQKKLETFKDQKKTVIFYEAPHRVIKSLEDIKDVLKDPVVVCARELTKKFEEVKQGKASELITHFSQKPPKGEFVLLLNLENCNE
ncbi:MAG: 16S rRNA (cytidine(1402)-2'-O)-methyltransferase [Candidatus Omnitrophica bacterium]|nr:16S rRNA (cytidine(1402)-2'-O)-methyltransferase [Candidatus Omnitrophota bacterium]